MSTPTCFTLEDIVIAIYCALDDALDEAGVHAKGGKLLGRRGPTPEVDDREILCLSVLQEILGFESDHRFCLWLEHNVDMRSLFPRRLPRNKFALRRAIVAPLAERLCTAFCELAGEGAPLFSSSTPTR